jgi:hypothetical protein
VADWLGTWWLIGWTIDMLAHWLEMWWLLVTDVVVDCWSIHTVYTVYRLELIGCGCGGLQVGDVVARCFNMWLSNAHFYEMWWLNGLKMAILWSSGLHVGCAACHLKPRRRAKNKNNKYLSVILSHARHYGKDFGLQTMKTFFHIQ